MAGGARSARPVGRSFAARSARNRRSGSPMSKGDLQAVAWQGDYCELWAQRSIASEPREQRRPEGLEWRAHGAKRSAQPRNTAQASAQGGAKMRNDHAELRGAWARNTPRRKIPFSRAKIASLQFPRPKIRRILAETGRGGSGGGACSPVHQLVKIDKLRIFAFYNSRRLFS